MSPLLLFFRFFFIILCPPSLQRLSRYLFRPLQAIFSVPLRTCASWSSFMNALYSRTGSSTLLQIPSKMIFSFLSMLFLVHIAPWGCLPHELLWVSYIPDWRFLLFFSQFGILSFSPRKVDSSFHRLYQRFFSFVFLRAPFPQSTAHLSCRISCAVSRVGFGFRNAGSYCWSVVVGV